MKIWEIVKTIVMAAKTKSKRQVGYLLSSGSPLSSSQKTKLKSELHSGAVKMKKNMKKSAAKKVAKKVVKAVAKKAVKKGGKMTFEKARKATFGLK